MNILTDFIGITLMRMDRFEMFIIAIMTLVAVETIRHLFGI